MIKVSGIDAVMIYADDPAVLSRWYATHLGIRTERNASDGNYYADGGVQDVATGHCVQFGIYSTSDQLRPARGALMVNYRVEDFDAAVNDLRANHIPLTDITEEECGRFAHLCDPEGNPIEIWSPRR